MKRILLFTLLLLPAMMHSYAQKPVIEKSESFDEPTFGWNKVLQLKNGNTFYFHIKRKEGIEVTVYDKSRKAISNVLVESEYLEPKRMNQIGISGLYEIAGEPVLFYIQMEGRSPILYRMRFDPFKGNVIKEEAIGELPRVKAGNGEGNYIYVEKDPQTDCYAAIFFNGTAKDKDDRIKVVHYNGNHKVINIGYYESPEDDYRLLRYIGAVVDGDKRVFISVYGSVNFKGKDAHVYISRLNSTDSTFTSKTLNFTEDFRDTKSQMYYNHSSNSIQLLSVSQARAGMGGTTFMSFLSYIDPETLGLKSVKPVQNRKVNEYAVGTLGFKRGFSGLPQRMIVNKDNSVTVLSEEITHVVTVQNNVYYYTSTLGSIGLTEMDADGNEKEGYMMAKIQQYGGLVENLYIANRAKGIWTFAGGTGNYNDYMSFDYVNTGSGRYILFNDNPRNFDRDEDERRRNAAVRVDKLHTICYSVSGGAVNKSFLFGDPETTNMASRVLTSTADYDVSTGTYAAVVMENPDKGESVARVVWVKFP